MAQSNGVSTAATAMAGAQTNGGFQNGLPVQPHAPGPQLNGQVQGQPGQMNPMNPPQAFSAATMGQQPAGQHPQFAQQQFDPLAHSAPANYGTNPNGNHTNGEQHWV
jgi:hypothetical protein